MHTAYAIWKTTNHHNQEEQQRAPDKHHTHPSRRVNHPTMEQQTNRPHRPPKKEKTKHEKGKNPKVRLIIFSKLAWFKHVAYFGLLVVHRPSPPNQDEKRRNRPEGTSKRIKLSSMYLYRTEPLVSDQQLNKSQARALAKVKRTILCLFVHQFQLTCLLK
ncbi:hypothetical protein PGT21_035868 [Puccinia graminis f. sp. tritici]|uniref:Uncharacterized protein n=1 Tax=Puccinia graminis f. sp. tritici TaxID=56615 RepID=A0A5B0QCS5_PUCGR|nr:hypothetical protein PGT21_035868 [Puccinia graminis f. sp. tritici]